MNDSNDKKRRKSLLSQINQILREYFDIRRQRAELKIKFDKKQVKLAEKYAEADAPLAELESQLASRLRFRVVRNRTLLFSGKLKSFATMYGSVSIKKKAETTSIENKSDLEKQARKDGLLNKLGSFKRTWNPKKASDIKKWLADNPRFAAKYAPFLKDNGGEEELYVKSNTAYIEEFDPNRLTVKSVNVGKAEIEDIGDL